MKTVVSIMLVSVLLTSCDARHVIDQVSTFANVQAAALEIQEHVDRFGPISDLEALGMIRRRDGGLDNWRNPMIYQSKAEPGFSFLVISLGRDGALDTEAVSDYFDFEREDIYGDYDRDIVYRNSEPVTIATRK